MATSNRLHVGEVFRSFGSIASGTAGFALVIASSIATCCAGDVSKTEADRLISAAASAEAAGDMGKSRSLLQDAVKADPDAQLPHWQLGQVELNGKWVPAAEAQRQADADPMQVEYRKRRGATGARLQEQLALARWCRDNKLNDEAQLHWSVVLALNPTNKEALKAVDMTWKNGRLVNRNETPQQKERAQDAKNAAKHWEPIIAKWRHAVSGHDLHAHDAALDEIRAIDDLDAIPSMESVTLGRDANDMAHAEECLQIGLAFIDALAKQPKQAATDSLVRHAVLCPGNKARALATEKLKPRDPHDYVPALLSGLAMPIESSFNVSTDTSGSVHYSHALFREGPQSDWAYNLNKTTSQRDLGGHVISYDTYTGQSELGPPSESPIVTAAKKARVASHAESNYGQNASAIEARVAGANASADEMNSRIVPVLAGAIGKDYGDSPKAWWKWWSDENEYVYSEHPVDQHYDSERREYFYGFPSQFNYSSAPPPPPLPAGHSCFAAGTPVWTKTGKQAIDKVREGELVLTQDIDTGELKYEPVLRCTYRPSGKLMKLAMEGDELVATPGHPFWVPGSGWRMTKELGDSAVLHSLQHPVSVATISPADDGAAYNLVVAETNTYFVGTEGILVHDITPRGPAPYVVPGVPLK